MQFTILSSREFQRNAHKAQKATQNGPVIITHRGRPAHVLLTHDHYMRLVSGKRSLVEALAMPGLDDIEFEIPTRRWT